MSITFTGDPQAMQGCANSTASCLSELEGHLRGIIGVQGGLQTAVVSQGTGAAINTKLGDAHRAGTTLGGTLQEIITALGDFGVKADTQDLEGGARINSVAGADGQFDGGSAAGVSTSKVDTTSW
ncbi:hypothetical protein [Nocardia neocaledoniensis]|uniref:Uncharacterized protein n=1 Tax=Nocardia neocaledoniensis TaxID=236511 RepID=A0A317N1Y9_9NOCA|nr:hypothetical protein [Nocardia neocaledoniensis]PWV66960.1 hypothetical protein DFR69_12225 [Nocardia neocaledoniensis]